MLRELFAFVVVFVMAAGLLVACGGEEDGDEEDSSAGQKESAKAGETQKAKPEPIDAVQVAYENTVESETARVEFTSVTSGIPTGTTEEVKFRMTGEGVMSLTEQRGSMDLRMEPLGNFKFRMLGEDFYYKVPGQVRAEMPGTKPWIKANYDAFYEQQYGASFSELQASDPTDPTQQLEALEDVGYVEEIGRKKVRGAQTTHYRAVIDFEKMRDESGPEARKAYDEIIQQMGTSKMPVDVWLDDQNRVRRYQVDMKMAVPVPADSSTGQAGGSTARDEVRVVITEDIYDFGVPVEVSPPPPEKTMSQKEFERRMQQQMPQQQ